MYLRNSVTSRGRRSSVDVNSRERELELHRAIYILALYDNKYTRERDRNNRRARSLRFIIIIVTKNNNGKHNSDVINKVAWVHTLFSPFCQRRPRKNNLLETVIVWILRVTRRFFG